MLKFKNALAIFCPFELKFAGCEYINGIKENEIGQELKRLISSLELKIDSEVVENLTRACQGLSLERIRRVLSKIIASYKTIDESSISILLSEKKTFLLTPKNNKGIMERKQNSRYYYIFVVAFLPIKNYIIDNIVGHTNIQITYIFTCSSNNF